MNGWFLFWSRCWKVVKEATGPALHTAWWMVRVTVGVSFVVLLLQWCGLLVWFSGYVGPVFQLFGLPGEAAFAYLSGYFVNVYGCVAAASGMGLSVREMTILGAMVLATHAMVVECVVQRKTGTPLWQSITIRTVGAFVLGGLLNLVLPGRVGFEGFDWGGAGGALFAVQGDFVVMLRGWGWTILWLVLKMVAIIYCLNVFQRLLHEFGVMERVSRLMEPIMTVFGLPRRVSFLWIVANVVGLSYGASIMIDEANSGRLDRREIDLLNAHIGISHSNIEDLLMVCTLGAVWWVVLLSRWCVSGVVVWSIRGAEWLHGLVRHKWCSE